MDIEDNVQAGAESRCPKLGLREDAQTALAYLSEWNYCHQAHPLAAVSRGHQAAFCQTAAYAECPLLQDPAPQPLPRQARAHRRAHLHLGWILVLLLVAGLLLAWLGRGLLF